MYRLDRRTRVVVSLLFAIGTIAFLGACLDTASMDASDYSDSYGDGQSTEEQAENATGRTGDREVDAILMTGQIMDDIRMADGYHKVAEPMVVKSEDPTRTASLLDKSIALRPEDIRYRGDRALVALQQGDAELAQEHWETQDEIARNQGMHEQLWYWTGSADDLTTAVSQLRARAGDSVPWYTPEQKREADVIYTRMANVYEKVAEIYTIDGKYDWAQQMMDEAAKIRELSYQAQE